MTDMGVILGIVATVVSIVNGVYIIRQRQKAPDEKRWGELDAWRKTVDEKLNSDYFKIKKIEEVFEENLRFQRLALKSLKAIAGSGTGNDMQGVIQEIDDFLMMK